MASGKLFHQLADDEDQPPQAKKRRVASAVEKPRGVASQFRQTDVSDVREVSKMFEGKEFCVVNGTRGLTKEDAERKIAEVWQFVSELPFNCCFAVLQHGGSFVQTPGPDTFCVLVQKLIVRANSIIR